MYRDPTGFRERLKRWKNGEKVYDRGRIVHAAMGLDGEEPTDAIQRKLMPLELQQDPLGIQKRLDIARANAAKVAAMQSLTQIGPDIRTVAERQRGHLLATVDRELYRKELQKQKAAEGFLNLLSLTSPSTYIGLAIGQPITGAAALATDALAFGAAGALKSGAKSAARRAVTAYKQRGFNTLNTPRGLLSDEPLIARGVDMPSASDIYRMEGGADKVIQYFYDDITNKSLLELRSHPLKKYAMFDGLVTDKPTPEEVRLIFNNSVLPRMRNMRAGWHGGLLRPTVKSNVDAALDRGYTVYDERVWDKSSMKDFAGFQNAETGHIAIKDGLEDFALGHEYRHRLDRLLPKSPMESDIIEGAYDSDFLKLSEYYPKLKDVHMAHEAVTTNFDSRLNAIGKYHALNTDWKLQNKIISGLSDDLIIEAVRNSNGYGSKYIDWLEQQGKLATEHMKKVFADKHRDAMKFVGAFGIPASLSIPGLNTK